MAWMSGQIAVLTPTLACATRVIESTDFEVVDDTTPRPQPRLDGISLDFTALMTGDDDQMPAALVLSSGTTGIPKGILLTKRSLWHSVDVLTDVFALGPDEPYANLSPLRTIGGLRALVLACRHGNEVQFFDKGDATGIAYARAVGAHGAKVALCGASFVRLLDASHRWLRDEPNTLRALMSCGSLYDDEASKRVSENYQIDVVNAYGQTETSGIVMCEPLGVYRPRTMAPPLAGVQQHFRERGGGIFELGIETPTPFYGFVGAQETLPKIVWTGDLVSKHANGLRYEGRASHAIKTKDGVTWLFPELVETWLRAHLAIDDAVARPTATHDTLQVVIQTNHPLAPDLRGRLADALGAEYATVKLVKGNITRTPAGKLQRMEITSP